MNKNNEHYTIYNYAIQYNYTVNKKRSEQRIIIVEYNARQDPIFSGIYILAGSPGKNLEGRFGEKKRKTRGGKKRRGYQ